MSQIIVPNIAYFKEGEVYVYQLPEELKKELCQSHASPEKVFNKKLINYEKAVSYARAHPFKVHEKDVKSICMKLYREYSIVPVKDNMMTIGDKVAKDLTEYRIQGVRMEVNWYRALKSGEPKWELRKNAANDSEEDKMFYAYEQVACLIEDDKQ